MNPDQILNDLFQHFTEALLEKVKSGTATAADFRVIREFLKDQGVSGMPTAGSPLESLLNQLPFNSHPELLEID